MTHSSWHKSEGGQAVILIAIMFLALTMAVGLAIDAGQLFVARRTMQEAADAAAYAGAVVRYQNGAVSAARSAAFADAARNGYPTPPTNGFTVTVNIPPSSGLYAGDDKYVEVLISGPVKTSLVPAQSALTQVSVRGVAGAGPLNNGYAVISLDKGNTPSAFYAGPNAFIDLNGGGILVNSTSSTAAWSDQCDPAKFSITPPYGTDVAGGAHNSGACFPTTGDGVDVGQPQQADPFSGFPPPSTIGMTTYTSLPPGDPTVLTPGIWTVSFSGSGHTLYQLTSGIYILKGGGIDLGGNADIVSLPGGVFIFNTHTNYPGAFRTGIDHCGVINLQGNANSNLAAMTTGDYKNFLIYQDPACTNAMSIGGSQTAVFTGTGTIYLPNAEFVLDGNNATLTGSQLVAKTVSIQNGNLSIDFNAGSTAQPILPRLSE